MAEREVMVVYAPMILRSLAEIKEAFGWARGRSSYGAAGGTHELWKVRGVR